MALNLNKLVEDAKHSGSAKDAVVFIVQNIAMLINDAAGDPNRGVELYKEINSRAQDLANSAIDNRDVQPVAPHEDAHDVSTHRTNPVGPTLTGASRPPDQRDIPKPRLDPANPGAYESVRGAGPHVDTDQSVQRTNPTAPDASPKTQAEMAKGKQDAAQHRATDHATGHKGTHAKK